MQIKDSRMKTMDYHTCKTVLLSLIGPTCIMYTHKILRK